jgi:hypothetical protein
MAEKHIREVRRDVEMMFMGFADLIEGPEHRQSARDLVHDAVLELSLTVIGEQGEIVTDVEGVILSALDGVMNFGLEPPEA